MSVKKITASILAFLFISFNTVSMAAGTCRTEHLRPVSKKVNVNTVRIDNYKKVVDEKNVIAVSFDDVFFSKTAKAGDKVCFTVEEALYTCEGTLLFPACTKFTATVTNIQSPKWFNKNARVALAFDSVQLPDGKCIPVSAVPFTKDGRLKEGPWMTAGSILLSTVTLGIVGGGAGVGFGFIPSPSKVGVGIGAGIAVGCGVGLLSALITKGLHYRAKKGEQIFIILCNDLELANSCK